MYLDTDLNKIFACDIEGDPIPSTRVWCFCAVNLVTKEEVRLRSYDEIREWVEARRSENCKFVFHNGIGYDAPTLNRLLGTKITMNDIIDTMVMSMVYSPSLEGGHSLAAWGKRLGFPKTEWDDFSQWSKEQEDYCLNDAILCGKVYIALRSRMNQLKFTNSGLDIEHRSWHLIQVQKKNGFAFNIKEAHILYAKLREKENEIRDAIYKYWPPALEIVGSFKSAYKKDGSRTARYLQHSEQFIKLEDRDDGGYDAYDYVYFTIGSPKQRVEKLLELGWKPLEFTKPSKTNPKGSPQPTKKGKLSPSLVAFVEESGKEEVRLIAQWIEYNARANMINTWIEAYNEDSGCIHGSLWLANTLRYRHSDPNTANIPAVKVDKDDHPLKEELGAYTYEARDLWTVRSVDRVLVGVDAKGIQLRVLAHYLNNKKFTEAILSEDPHSANQKNFGLPSRALTKTITYAVLMGAGDNRIANEAKVSLKEAKEVKAMFFAQVPELQDLINRLKADVERRGRITLCDGTPILVDKPHTVIPFLLQGDESRIMKKAAIEASVLIKQRKLDVLKVCDIHDEWQNDVLKIHSEEFAYDVCPKAFASSGKFFDYRLPIDCDAKIGLTWACTH